MTARGTFFQHFRTLAAPRILELGTKRSVPDRCTTHRAELLTWNPSATHVGTDFEDGLDVDVVSDAHALTERVPRASFDAFVAASVFEHFRWPWIVALQLNAVLKVGGTGFIQSHQAFPLHGYPHDYWRFSTEAWGALFCAEAGWRLIAVDYEYPCRIVPATDLTNWDPTAGAYLNSNACVQKVADVGDGQFRWPVHLDPGMHTPPPGEIVPLSELTPAPGPQGRSRPLTRRLLSGLRRGSRGRPGQSSE